MDEEHGQTDEAFELNLPTREIESLVEMTMRVYSSINQPSCS